MHNPNAILEVAKKEQLDPDVLAESLLQGQVVIPFNNQRTTGEYVGIGRNLTIKINANIGTSKESVSIKAELSKLKVALEAGADAVMDLSTGGNLPLIRQKIRKHCPKPLGTVPIYETVVTAKNSNFLSLKADDFLQTVKRQAEEGVDFFTIHAGITRATLQTLTKLPRVTGIVSRGGAFLAAWMFKHDRENPYYLYFDQILEVCRQYNVTISLGDGLRPGSLADAGDKAQIEELLVLGTLVKRCREAGVQVIVEGPGHMPINQIQPHVELQKKVTHGAPFYVLGPLVVDVAAGYDHIAAAIGGAVAGLAGADFLCYVTPKEHLGLPTVGDVREGVIAAKIAAHAGDVVRKPHTALWDWQMSSARKALDWEKQLALALDPQKASKSYREAKAGSRKTCTMCSEFCALKVVADYLNVSEESSAAVCSLPDCPR